MLTPELEDTVLAAGGVSGSTPVAVNRSRAGNGKLAPRSRGFDASAPTHAEGIAGIAKVRLKLADGLADSLLQLDLRRRKPRRDLMPAYHDANGQIPEFGGIEAKNEFSARALDRSDHAAQQLIREVGGQRRCHRHTR